MVNNTLKDKVAIVTGSAQGIGRKIAEELALRGAKVALSDINEKVVQVAREIGREEEVMYVVADVSNEDHVEKMVSNVLERWGHIDILVNNAGIYPYKSLKEMTEADWDKVIDINLKGMFNCVKGVLPDMHEHGGSIINISSIAGTTVGYAQLAHYSASKAGMSGFTRSAAVELAEDGIRVNAIAPGAVETPTVKETMDEETRQATIASIPLKRLGKPEDIANLVAFLASEESSYITGQLIVIDGGMTIQ
ncbi:SDR family oxidoreductase [Candidatus Thorarchaeota archaeon]|nr:MAG: SDR family oxidoreductase [Candidatus Thorarchaeota archaeon]